MNQIELTGTIIDSPVYSHSVVHTRFYSVRFYSVTLGVSRNSGVIDYLQIIAPERLIPEKCDIGTIIHVMGRTESFTFVNADTGRRQMKIFVFATAIELTDADKRVNNAELECVICKLSPIRSTPLGKIITDAIVAVKKNPNYPSKSCYIPVVFWETNARASQGLSIGDKVYISGRLQSREYVKVIDGNEKTYTVYELSAATLDYISK